MISTPSSAVASPARTTPPPTTTPATRLAAIVVAYDGGDALLDCLRSLLAQTVHGLEVIVVDNASGDGSIERAEAVFGTGIRVIRRATNGGYAAGANTGWRATDTPIVAILNQDLAFEPDCLEQMRQVLLDETRDALVTPKLVLRSDPSRVNAIGNDVHLSGVAWCHGLGTPADDWHGVVEVTAISGAAFMGRRSLLEQLGGLEEAYFMYMEDVDLSLRARLAGGVCLAACDAVATNDWSLSLTPEKFGLLERNRRWMWWRFFEHDRRISPALVEAELLGWAYAAMNGLGFVSSKIRGFRASAVARPARLAGSSVLLRQLRTSLPYSVVGVRSPVLLRVGATLDRAAVGAIRRTGSLPMAARVRDEGRHP